MQRVTIRKKLVGAGTQQTTLRGKNQIFWIGVQSFCNQGFADFWSIGFSGINQGDTQILRALQDRDCCIPIGGWPPDSVASETHGTKAKASNKKVPTNRKGTACCDEMLISLFHQKPFSQRYSITTHAEKQHRYPGTHRAQQMAFLTGCMVSFMCSYLKVYTLERTLSQGGDTFFFSPLDQEQKGTFFLG